MKIIDGTNAILGRLASFAAKEIIKGENIVIINCEEIKISGNRLKIKEKIKEKRSKIGSGQKGPKYSRINHNIVKRAIRGMLPSHRTSRGQTLLKNIKCFSGTPNEFHDKETIKLPRKISNKFIKIKELKK